MKYEADPNQLPPLNKHQLAAGHQRARAERIYRACDAASSLEALESFLASQAWPEEKFIEAQERIHWLRDRLLEVAEAS